MTPCASPAITPLKKLKAFVMFSLQNTSSKEVAQALRTAGVAQKFSQKPVYILVQSRTRLYLVQVYHLIERFTLGEALLSYGYL